MIALTINMDDEKESTEQVISAPNNASAMEKNQTIEQPKRKRGRPRKSDRNDFGSDEKEPQPKRKRGRPRKSGPKDGGTEEKESPPKRKGGRPRKSDQKGGGSDEKEPQPKRKRGRPRKSDPKDGETKENESTQEDTQAPDNAFAMDLREFDDTVMHYV
jgi:AT hook motif